MLIFSIALFFGLTPEQITEDLMSMMRPDDTLRDKVRNIRGNKKKHRLYRILVNIKGALESTGKSKQFAVVMCASVVLFAAGIIASVLINNLFLMPVLAVTFALIPFFYITNILSVYDKQTKEELETALSIITTSYERCDDILQAVRENIRYIKQDALLGLIPSATSTIINVLTLSLGVWFVMKGIFSVGMMFAFQGFMSQFLTPMQQLIGAGQTIQEMRTSMERVEDVMKYPEDPVFS